MFYTYVLESLESERRYIGHTDDLRRRLKEHNDGKSSQTAKYRPWKVKCYFAFETRELAQRFERYLKSGSGFSFSKRHFE
jgi:predicted GIY-YIG superfamily endonuclease